MDGDFDGLPDLNFLTVDFWPTGLYALLCNLLALAMFAVFASTLTLAQSMSLIAALAIVSCVLPLVVWIFSRPQPFPAETLLFAIGALLMSAIVAGFVTLAYGRPHFNDSLAYSLLMSGIFISMGAFFVFWFIALLRSLWSQIPIFANSSGDDEYDSRPENPLREKSFIDAYDFVRSGFDFFLFVLGLPFHLIANLAARWMTALLVLLVLPLLLIIWGGTSAYEAIKNSADAERQYRKDSATRNRRTRDFYDRTRSASGARRHS